jgi:uncharacterized membrane protein
MDLASGPGGRALLFLLALLALAGLAIAGYFTGVSYRLIAPDTPFIPRRCRLGAATCARVLDSPQARVFGLPNSLLGMAYYAAVIGLVLAGGPGAASGPLLLGFRLVALGTVALGAYLSASLLFITRVPCILCFTAHGINLAIALLMWLGAGRIGG